MAEEVNIGGNAVKKVSLSKKDTTDVKKITNLMVDIVKRQRRLWRKEFNDWEMARRARYSIDYPKNYLLQELYKDIMLDGHLTAVTGSRSLRNTNKDFIFTIDGKKNDTLTEFIENKSWFQKVIENAQDSVYYGGTLLWIKEFEKGNIKDIELVDREQIVPEKNLLLYDVYEDKGIDFSEASSVLWYAQFYDYVGLLEKAAPFTILKRHSWGSWDEFEEKYGVPIMIAKIASQSSTVKNEVAGWMEEMGSSSHGVFPIGTDIEIKENTKSDVYNIFFKKIEAANDELSKLVQHQTMTTENGSSRSQGEVHENTFKEVVKADEKKMLSFLNDTVVPGMRELGYAIPENAKISVAKVTNPKDQIEIDKPFITNGYILEKDYIEETYGTKIAHFPNQITETKGKD